MQHVLSNNFGKVRRIVVIFAHQHQESKQKLIVQQKSISTNQRCYLTLQNETLSEPLHKKTKRGQNSRKKTVKSVSA